MRLRIGEYNSWKIRRHRDAVREGDESIGGGKGKTRNYEFGRHWSTGGRTYILFGMKAYDVRERKEVYRRAVPNEK